MGATPEWLREVLLDEGGLAEGKEETGVVRRSPTRKRGVIVRQQAEEKMVRRPLCRFVVGDVTVGGGVVTVGDGVVVGGGVDGDGGDGGGVVDVGGCWR